MKNEDNTGSLEISQSFLEILKGESQKVWEVCYRLNANTQFRTSIEEIRVKAGENISYKAEHILMRDVVKVFEEFVTLYGDSLKIANRSKFILIYLYEKLHGRDLATTYDLKKINQIPVAKQFNKNVITVRETIFFTPITEASEVYLLPSVLSKLNHKDHLVISSFIHRIATLIANEDKKIT